MELRSGYKQTEVGVIPEDWEIRSIGDLASVSAGGTPSRKIPEYWNGAIPWITTSQIDFGMIAEADQFITEDGLYNSATKLLPAGTLLMALYGQGKTRGKVGVLGFEATTNQACAAISIHGNVSREFLLHFLISRYEAIRNSSNSGSQENLNGQIVKDISIAFPPTKAEQETIAEALSDTDALIESLEQLIAKKRHLKQGAMQELLTGKKRLPGFSGEWEVSTLSAVSKEPMQNGIFYSPALKGVGVRLINVGDLYNCAPIDTDSLELFGATEKECERFRVEDGDLFFTRSSIVPSGIAHCNIYRALKHEPVVFDSHVIRMRPDTTKVDPSYLFRFCISSVARHYLISHAKTATMTTIDQGVLGKCPVLLPSKAEQTAITTILSDMDAEITSLETRLAKTRQLKQGMMHNLLTGRIRLIE